MPLINSNFKPLKFFKSGFISTVYSGLIRYFKIQQFRERILLPDGDFLDLDWSYSNQTTDKIAIILHGMEGHTKTICFCVARYLNLNKFDAICKF